MSVSIVKKSILYKLYEWEYVFIADESQVQPSAVICDADKATHINAMLIELDTTSKHPINKPINAFFPIDCLETQIITKQKECYMIGVIDAFDITIKFPGQQVVYCQLCGTPTPMGNQGNDDDFHCYDCSTGITARMEVEDSIFMSNQLGSAIFHHEIEGTE